MSTIVFSHLFRLPLLPFIFFFLSFFLSSSFFIPRLIQDLHASFGNEKSDSHYNPRTAIGKYPGFRTRAISDVAMRIDVDCQLDRSIYFHRSWSEIVGTQITDVDRHDRLVMQPYSEMLTVVPPGHSCLFKGRESQSIHCSVG